MLWNKDSDMHRLARQRPWWETAAVFIGLLAFINAASAAMYLGNRWYQSWRPSGNEIYVMQALDVKLFSRPDLAVAAVRMVLHYALSGTATPFGAPMVAPPYLKEEAEELLDLVLELHEENPAISVPDLWAILSGKALARLGGPNITIRRGREGPEEIHAPEEEFLQIAPSLVPEDKRDVLSMKRLLAHQGFSLEQIVALISCYRNIGFHACANFHTKEEVKPHMARNRNIIGPDTSNFNLPDLIDKCTLDPYVFGGEYFDLLLDYDWKQAGIFKKSDSYRCSGKDRRREVVLLDPFSEQSLEAEKRRMEAAQKAASTLDDATRSRSGVVLSKDGSLYGRTGEAQFIKGSTHAAPDDDDDVKKATAEVAAAFDSANIEEDDGTVLDPCEHVSMRGTDIMLLDDALTRGWLYKFSDNEINYYAAVGEVFTTIQEHGYNVNNLHDSGRMT